MSDPSDQNAGATPPEDPPAGEAPEARTQATPPSEAQTLSQAAPAAAVQPTAQATPAGPWYRRRWALITGAAAAAAILLLGGMAIGDAVWGQDRPGDFRGDHLGMFRDGDDRGMGQGHGWDRDGEGYGQRGERWDRDGCPGDCDDPSEATPAPSTSPQAYYQ